MAAATAMIGIGAGILPVAAAAATGAHSATSVPTAALPPDALLGHGQGGGKGGKGASAAYSLDWAGFAVTGTTFSSVSGSWNQPTAACVGSKPSQSAFWVGIDGYLSNDPTVQQVGTDADCVKHAKKVPGGPSYYAWYELYPDNLVVLPTASYPVAPGDDLSGSVAESGSSITLSLTDAGRWTYSTVQTAPAVPLAESAGWIAEAPTLCTSKCKTVSLTDFGSVAFKGATANGQPVDAAGYTDHQITMAKNKSGKVVKASPSALSGGDDFTVTWVNA